MRRLPIGRLLGVALLTTGLFFYLVPDVDLATAALFYRGQNTFVGQTPAGEALRRVIYWIPTLVLAVFAALFVRGRLGQRSTSWAPAGRELAVLAMSFALGPGLLVNTVLKDHSHRPRPSQTVNFGGEDAFRPFYTFDGACERNCSFVSGEGAAAFWTVVPALMTPLPMRPVAVAVAVAFGAGAATLRMAFGGHYLSDTIFAALTTWTVAWLVWRTLLGRRRIAAPNDTPTRS